MGITILKPAHERTILIDGDTIAYQAGTSNKDVPVDPSVSFESLSYAEIKLLKEQGVATQRVPLTMSEMMEKVDNTLTWLKDHLEADKVVICLSDPKENFRKDVYPPYKTHRDAKERPEAVEDMKEYLRVFHGAYHWPRLEADDMQGILATAPRPEGFETVIVSIDKDLRQIPGLLFNPQKPDLGVQQISPEAGLRWTWAQTIIGDPVDGYPGIPMVGPAKAEKLFTELENKGIPLEDWWPHIVDYFKGKGFDEAYALTQLHCARILQHGDYNPQVGFIHLENPSRQAA